jgi:hypothetical protein
MSDDNDDDDSTVTITGSSSLGGFSGSGISSLTAPSISTITVGGGGGGGGVGVIGHTGTTGSYYISSSGTGTPWSSPQAGSTVLKTSKGNEIDVDELAEVITIMKERLLILIPAFEKHEKYAALKKAYDNYKMIEALIQEDRKDD